MPLPRGPRAAALAGRGSARAAGARRGGRRRVLGGAKLSRGRQLSGPPALVRSDALQLPFRDASFDRVMSICAIEHFDDGEKALGEMARVLAPGGELVMSADSLTLAERWPKLYTAHCERYSVQRTYSYDQLSALLGERGFEVVEHEYQFCGEWAQ